MVFPVPNCILQDSETLLITNSLHPCLSRSVHRSRGLLVRIPAVSYTHVIRRKVCLRSDMGTGRFHIGHFLRSFLNYKKLVSEFVLFLLCYFYIFCCFWKLQVIIRSISFKFQLRKTWALVPKPKLKSTYQLYCRCNCPIQKKLQVPQDRYPSSLKIKQLGIS